jgi:nitrate/nitrite transporter NarK
VPLLPETGHQVIVTPKRTGYLVVQGVPPEQTGVASGMNANIRTIGGSIGAAVMSSVVTSATGAGGLPRESGYTHGFGLLTLAAIAAAVAAMLVPRRCAAERPGPRRSDQHQNRSPTSR